MIRYTDNHKLQIYLAQNDVMPIKESGKTAYYHNTYKYKRLVERYYCRQLFYRGGKWEA